jgi:hypothetical protein
MLRAIAAAKKNDRIDASKIAPISRFIGHFGKRSIDNSE